MPVKAFDAPAERPKAPLAIGISVLEGAFAATSAKGAALAAPLSASMGRPLASLTLASSKSVADTSSALEEVAFSALKTSALDAKKTVLMAVSTDKEP
jgi:hypothetical protein